MKYLKKQKGFEDYKKVKDVFDLLEGRLEFAKENAKKLKQHHLNHDKNDLFNIFVTPYTNVWELIVIIQKLSNLR